MKTFRRMLCLALIAMFLCASALPAFAADTRTFYLGGKGTSTVEYIGIELGEGDKITDVKSSNKKIFTIYSFGKYHTHYIDTEYEDEEYESDSYSAEVDIMLKKKGTANVTYKLNGQTQKIPVKILAYTNPVKTFKLTGLGKTNLASKFKKTRFVNAKSKKTKAGYMEVTAAKGWKIEYISFQDSKAQNSRYIYAWDNPVSSLKMNVPAMKKGREYYASARLVNESNGADIYVSYHLSK